MPRFTVEVVGRWHGAEVGFQQIRKKMKDARIPLKKAIYNYMEGSVKSRFDVGGKPRWKKRAVKSWNGVPQTHPLLIRTGRMMRSVTLRTSTNKNITHPDKQSITLASKVPYAKYHDKDRGYGPPNPSDGRPIYGRPFLEFTGKDVDNILDEVADWAWREAQKEFGTK